MLCEGTFKFRIEERFVSIRRKAEIAVKSVNMHSKLTKECADVITFTGTRYSNDRDYNVFLGIGQLAVTDRADTDIRITSAFITFGIAVFNSGLRYDMRLA